MKKILLSVIAIVMSIAVYSDTIPEGDIFGTWTLAGSPYYINGTTTVPDDSTLNIEAGVVVEWLGSYTMYIEGQILALGTETDSVLFTAADPETGFKSITFFYTDATNDTSRFEYCIFEHGKAYGMATYNSGGALAAWDFDKIIVDFCMFRNNRSLDNTFDPNPVGGAISMLACNMVIRNSVFTNNMAFGGGAIFCYGGSHPLIENNVFKDNFADGEGLWGQGYGGAINCYKNCDPVIKNNIFSENIAFAGGAISFVSLCNPVIDHNLFYYNIADGWGGAIEIQDTSTAYIINNTIAYNESNQNGGGIDLFTDCNVEIRNTILWGNTAASSGPEVYLHFGDTANFYYCDIQGGQGSVGGPGHLGKWNGNIDADPLFLDTASADYNLIESSPCIDAGDPTMFDPDNTIIDIGAFFYDQAVGYPEYHSEQGNYLECFPNPAKGVSDCRLQISDLGRVTLKIFDLNGREIATLMDEPKPAGEYTVRFDASDLPAGVYMVRLQAGEQRVVRKLLVQ